ncbi:DUF6678 family protein [uncultured Tenacibaculum sp.]|uniref:DUF6678 family protein n=1 Tax=uncultured Tenacibaculum sp. TaxID=174713 RepID=UPI002626E395|nr:DUF6678 family protein [uncultured Tenacibaculum sp.]
MKSKKMLEKIYEIVKEKNCTIRLNWFYDPDYEVSDWNSYLNFPIEGYFEPQHIGPIKVNQWKWLEINPIEIKIIGKLIQNKEVDHSIEIIRMLKENNISFSQNRKYLRVENTWFVAET